MHILTFGLEEGDFQNWPKEINHTGVGGITNGMVVLVHEAASNEFCQLVEQQLKLDSMFSCLAVLYWPKDCSSCPDLADSQWEVFAASIEESECEEGGWDLLGDLASCETISKGRIAVRIIDESQREEERGVPRFRIEPEGYVPCQLVA